MCSCHINYVFKSRWSPELVSGLLSSRVVLAEAPNVKLNCLLKSSTFGFVVSLPILVNFFLFHFFELDIRDFTLAPPWH